MNNHKTITPHHNTTTKNNNNRRSMSDTDDEFHTPVRSPIQQQLDDNNNFPSSPSKAIVPVDNKYYSSFPSPSPTKPPPPPAISYNRQAREESVTGVAKVSDGGGGDRRETEGGGGVERRGRRGGGMEGKVEKMGLGLRVMEMIVCLIAFSVMASDKTQGWSGDSFDRYREYRYLVAVNAIGFAYAAFQAVDMTYHLIYGKHIISHYLRPHFDFLIDQILAYLLISASSSSATRVDDWVSNWGKDNFTQMATASIGMSFLAFLAFSLSSIISGYNLCNQSSL